MDGITDAAFRYIIDTYGKPDIMFTEFIPVEAINRGISRILYSFLHHKTNTLTVAQIFGYNLQSFYKAALVACEMGFDGVDINMGCPDKHVVGHGGGAALILQPKHAIKIISVVKKAVRDWFDGFTVDSRLLSGEIISFIGNFRKKSKISVRRRMLPVSVKTRIGFDKIITADWIKALIQARPSSISLHGRTLKQLYSGKADWEEIAKGALLCAKENIPLFGNGDVQSLNEALQKAKLYKTQGVLIGRAALGNPWIFKNKVPSMKERFAVLIEHTKKFVEYRPDLKIYPMRKHFTWYCKNFSNSAKIRNGMMKVSSLKDLIDTLHSYKLVF